MKLTAFAASAAAAFAFCAGPVQATPLLFTISGDFDAQFQLDSTPAPDLSVDGYVFVVEGVSGFSNAPSGLADLGFYNLDASGGLLVRDTFTSDILFDTFGPQLYSGPESAPNFEPGVFALTGLSTPGSFTLTIASVPEPESWALMISGFGLAGLALRRQRTRAAFTLA